jgi:hypothetical protein
MTFRYTKLDDGEGLDGGPRFEIEEVCGFVSCVVDDEDTARLFCAALDLLEALEELVERERAEAASNGFTDDEMAWLEDSRRAIRKAKGGAA